MCVSTVYFWERVEGRGAGGERRIGCREGITNLLRENEMGRIGNSIAFRHEQNTHKFSCRFHLQITQLHEYVNFNHMNTSRLSKSVSSGDIATTFMHDMVNRDGMPRDGKRKGAGLRPERIIIHTSINRIPYLCDQWESGHRFRWRRDPHLQTLFLWGSVQQTNKQRYSILTHDPILRKGNIHEFRGALVYRVQFLPIHGHVELKCTVYFGELF